MENKQKSQADNNDDEFGIVNLFTNLDYKEITYEYEGLEKTNGKLKLKALNTASTDFDLTGQIVWQGADIFCKVLLSKNSEGKQIGRELLGGKNILELGSGPGLGGFLASKWAKSVILTDYQDLLIDLMTENIANYNIYSENNDCEMFTAKLDWKEVVNEGYFEGIDLINEESSISGKLIERKIDFIIGTDLIFFSSSVTPLIDTLDKLNNSGINIPFYMIYIQRAANIHQQLRESLEQRGYTYKDIEKDTTKPINENCFLYKIEKK